MRNVFFSYAYFYSNNNLQHVSAVESSSSVSRHVKYLSITQHVPFLFTAMSHIAHTAWPKLMYEGVLISTWPELLPDVVGRNR